MHFYGLIISGLLNLRCLKAYSELKWKTREVADHLEAVCVLVLKDFYSFSLFRGWSIAKIRSWHLINYSRLSKQIENVPPRLQMPTSADSLQGFLLKSSSSMVHCIVSPSSELIFFPKLAWISLDGLN